MKIRMLISLGAGISMGILNFISMDYGGYNDFPLFILASPILLSMALGYLWEVGAESQYKLGYKAGKRAK